jgi:hypothetical protein
MAAIQSLEMCPSQLVDICARLTRTAEAASGSNDAQNMLPFSATQIRQALTTELV